MDSEHTEHDQGNANSATTAGPVAYLLVLQAADRESAFDSELVDKLIVDIERKRSALGGGSVIDLWLDSTRGDIHAVYRLARFLRESFRTIRCVIPHSLSGAGLLLGAAGSELVMGAASVIGTIDHLLPDPEKSDQFLSAKEMSDLVDNLPAALVEQIAPRLNPRVIARARAQLTAAETYLRTLIEIRTQTDQYDPSASAWSKQVIDSFLGRNLSGYTTFMRKDIAALGLRVTPATVYPKWATAVRYMRKMRQINGTCALLATREQIDNLFPE